MPGSFDAGGRRRSELPRSHGLLLEAPGIHPPVHEFEALLAGSGRLKEERA